MRIFQFPCYGHENILSTHKTTIEFTKDSELTLDGDCILGIKADFNSIRALRGLSSLFLNDNMFYDDNVDETDLRAWCISNGYDFGMVKNAITSYPPRIAELRKEEP